MKRHGLLISVLFPVLACHRPARVEIQKVLVPVPVPCPPATMPPRPTLPCARLQASDSPESIQKALVATLQILQGHIAALEARLQPYLAPEAPR